MCVLHCHWSHRWAIQQTIHFKDKVKCARSCNQSCRGTLMTSRYRSPQYSEWWGPSKHIGHVAWLSGKTTWYIMTRHVGCIEEIVPHPPLYSNIRIFNHSTPNTFLLVRGITDSSVCCGHCNGSDRHIDDVSGPFTGTRTAQVLHRVDGDALYGAEQRRSRHLYTPTSLI